MKETGFCQIEKDIWTQGAILIVLVDLFQIKNTRNVSHSCQKKNCNILQQLTTVADPLEGGWVLQVKKKMITEVSRTDSVFVDILTLPSFWIRYCTILMYELFCILSLHIIL